MRQITPKFLILSFGWFLLIVPPSLARVKLPALFGENMVLQQGRKVPIWGTSDPAEQVTVTFRGQRVTETADDEGRWKVELGPWNAGGPFEMTVGGENTITLRNVLVGEVWICSGQSNMEMAVGNSPTAWGGVLDAEREIATANYRMIRVFTVKKAVAEQPQRDTQGQWVVASPKTAGKFSAVGYFFSRELHKTLGIPVGLIHTSWGGSMAEAWTSKPALESDPDFKPILDRWDQFMADHPGHTEQFRQLLEQWELAAQKAEAEVTPAVPVPKLVDYWRGYKSRASGLYNAMLAPLIPYAIRGVIWYQGEANADRAYQYRELFPTMIRDWRRAWRQGDFPFLFVQLANYEQSYVLKGCWPELREAQLMTLSLPKTGMAVTVDIGDPNDIHPKNKQEVGRRLALAAQAIAYGRKVVYSGPIYKSMTIEGEKIRLSFNQVDGGLVAKGSKLLKGFEIAAEDRKFVPADAKIDGDTVVVRGDKMTHPVAVRYAWADSPECNLYNRAGLPASPFRTDNWPGITAGKL